MSAPFDWEWRANVGAAGYMLDYRQLYFVRRTPDGTEVITGWDADGRPIAETVPETAAAEVRRLGGAS